MMRKDKDICKEKKMGIMTMLFKLLKMRAQDGWIALLIIIVVGVFHGASMGVNTIITKEFFDKVASGVTGDTGVKIIMLWGVILGAGFILNQILNGLHNYLAEFFLMKQTGKVMTRIIKKMGKLDILKFENTETLDELKKVEEGAQMSIFFTFIFLTISTFYIPYFIMMGAYLYSLRPLLALSLIFIFIPVVLTQVLRLKLFTKLTDESAPIKREFQYYEKCMTDKEYFKETRILGGRDYFLNRYKKALNVKQFELPESIIPISVISMGYPDETNLAKNRFDSSKVHREVWENK